MFAIKVVVEPLECFRIQALHQHPDAVRIGKSCLEIQIEVDGSFPRLDTIGFVRIAFQVALRSVEGAALPILGGRIRNMLRGLSPLAPEWALPLALYLNRVLKSEFSMLF